MPSCALDNDVIKTLSHSLTRRYVCAEACMHMYTLVDVGTSLQKWLWPCQCCMIVIQYLIVYDFIMGLLLSVECSSSGKWPSHMIKLVALAGKLCCPRKTWRRWLSVAWMIWCIEACLQNFQNRGCFHLNINSICSSHFHIDIEEVSFWWEWFHGAIHNDETHLVSIEI